MTINTKKVQGRRSVRFESLDDMLADAERLVNGKARLLGNWSLGQILLHLALIQNGSIDGFPKLLPRPIRFLLTLFFKKRFLNVRVPPSGPKLKMTLIPEATSDEEGLAALRNSAQRVKTETQRAVHPVLGTLTREEWNQLYLRHGEMHLSFAVPAGPAAPNEQDT